MCLFSAAKKGVSNSSHQSYSSGKTRSASGAFRDVDFMKVAGYRDINVKCERGWKGWNCRGQFERREAVNDAERNVRRGEAA
jgi:hypothetical protein